MHLSIVPPKDRGLGHLSTDFHLLFIEACSWSFNASIYVAVSTYCWAVFFRFGENPEEQNSSVLAYTWCQMLLGSAENRPL